MRYLGLVVCFLVLTAFPVYGYTQENSYDHFAYSANIGYGPLNLRSQSPLQLFRLTMKPDTPDTLRPGELEMLDSTTWCNLWMLKKGQFMIDAEIIQITTEINYGLTNCCQIGLEVPVIWRTNGILDGFIEDFHDAFHIGQHHRTDSPRNRLLIEFLNPDDKTYWVVTDKDIGFNDITGRLKYQLTDGDDVFPAVALTGMVKFPTTTSREYSVTSGLDAGFSLSLAKGWDRFYLYTNLGEFFFGQDQLGPLELRNKQGSLLLAGEYRLGAKTSLLLQYLANTAAAKDFADFGKSTHEITLGLKHQITSNTLWEFGLLENMINYDNSPDLGFHFGIDSRF